MLVPGIAAAQVELVDPDAPTVRTPPKKPPPEPSPLDEPDTVKRPVEPDADPEEPGPSAEEPDEPVRPVKRPAADAGVKAGKDAKGKDPKDPKAAVPPPPPPPPPRKPPATVLVTKLTETDLSALWQAWQKADASNDVSAEKAARSKLLAAKQEIAADNLELWAIGLLRASAAHEERGDSGGAVEIALTATQLAPDLPAVWSGLATTYVQADPSELGRIIGALKTAFVLHLQDPRYLRPALGDLGTALLVALLGVAIALVAVLFLRRAYYFLYDVHFFFPRAAARWQTGALALIVLALPIVFRMGVVPALLALFAAATLYLTTPERLVAAVLVSLLGLLPTAGALLVEGTAFAGTPAEDVYVVERGGPGAQRLADRFEQMAAGNKAQFQHLFALGRYELRRGRLEAAVAHLKQALVSRPNDARATVNLGAAMALSGDLENSLVAFEDAVKADPSLAVAYFNLGRLHQRRVAVLGDSVAGEVDKASAMLSEARLKDAALSAGMDEAPKDTYLGNELFLSLPLPRSELVALAAAPEAAQRVRSQLNTIVLGDVPEGVAPFYPLLASLGLLVLGLLSKALGTAKPCSKCGAAVSRRGDPEVAAGSSMCTQCVNVFARKNLVEPAAKVRKQAEVARYQQRSERVSYVLGLLFAGMGHAFAGLPVRGAVYGFLFAAAITGFFLRNGVLRPPYEAMPLAVRLAPVVLIFVLVYALSLRGLLKRQG